MTGWEAVLEWSAGGPNRRVELQHVGTTQRMDHVEPRFEVRVGLVSGPLDGSKWIVWEAAVGSLDEAAAAALAAWRKRML